MPTGYTADIANDISFTDYALGCARAFGACMHQRDTNASEKPAFAKLNPYYEQSLIEDQKQLEDLLAMNIPAQQEYGITRIKERTDVIQGMFNKAIELRRKYEAILTQAQAWNPPGPDFEGYKQFMIDQITDSIKFDCDTEYYVRELTALSNSDPLDVYTEELNNARKSVEYSTEQFNREIERVNKSNAWIATLYKALGEDAPAV